MAEIRIKEKNTPRGTEVEYLVTDIDAFYEEPAKTYLAKGHHIVTLAHWELVPAKEVVTRTDNYTTKPYIMLDLVDVKTNEATTARLYSGFVPYFLDQIAAQTAGAIGGMKLSEVLAYLQTHKFEIWVSYDKSMGVQVNYQQPRK